MKKAGGIIVIIAGVFLALSIGWGCGGEGESKKKQKDEKGKKEKKAKEKKKIKVRPIKKNPIDVIMDHRSLSGAISYAKKYMGSTRDKPSKGALIFGAWSMKRLKWSELQLVEKTKYALVEKDPETEIGKKMCVRGKVIQIRAERTSYGKMFTGLMFKGASYRSNVVSFFAVGSTGEIVARKRARFCGIVTGIYTYSNTGGGTTHAVQMVGMFKLKANMD